MANVYIAQTMNQFRDFQKFIEKVDKYGMRSGIVKVIPPPEW
jgi:jmjN domain